MTLPEAINRAGGITAAGDRSFVTLTRSNETTVVDLMQLQELGVNPNQILLESGDLVTVRSRDDSKVFVMGEILRPSALPMRNGRLSLNEALGEAGGPNLVTANTSQIYVIRNTAQAGSPAVFHLNAGNPTALALAETFPLRPRDVVYIDPVPLVNWNRIVSLILPSALGAQPRRQRDQVMKSILVICEGNICRSPMAQGLLAAACPGCRCAPQGLGALVGMPADDTAIRLMQEARHRHQRASGHAGQSPDVPGVGPGAGDGRRAARAARGPVSAGARPCVSHRRIHEAGHPGPLPPARGSFAIRWPSFDEGAQSGSTVSTSSEREASP